MALRKEVLSLYRRIFRLARTWTAQNPDETWQEQEYIKDEARRLFRKNKNVTNEADIQDFLKEGEARVEIALHYQNPYPRPVYAPPNVLIPSERKSTLRGTQRRLKQSKPIYVKSYDEKQLGSKKED
ncbi:unnamed protein product, partial [Owenia fusiformis]